MKRIGTSTSIHRRVRFAAVAMLAAVIGSASLALAQATDRVIDQAQRAVQERITSEEGRRDLTVQFARDVRTESPSNAQILVRGTGSVTRATDRSLRPFSYEAVVNTRSNKVIKIQYDWRGQWAATGRNAVANRLTGTYRLNPQRSDNPASTARAVTRNLPAGDQERLRTAVERRLASPESLAIERDGRTITIASSMASRVTFDADGREQIEQSRNARRVRTTATLSGDRLVVTTDGDRSVDYQVTFESFDNGRSLRVTRRITHEDLRQAVVAMSVYDKTSNTPQWDIYTDVRRGAGVAARNDEGGGYIVPDGTDLVAVLNNALSTSQARDGDRFALTVRTPSQYADATIEGSLVHVARSGQVSGRAEMSFAFDAIRLRNGRVYDFTGYIDSVRAPNDDAVRVDTEGVVQDDTGQAGRTATRTGIGAAIGAVIGAVTGGGKGAAIGAAIGAGAGAGSVFIQGRSDLDLVSGTEFRIRAGAPR